MSTKFNPVSVMQVQQNSVNFNGVIWQGRQHWQVLKLNLRKACIPLFDSTL